MALTKYRLGELIQFEDTRNSGGQYTLDDVKGISIQKVFIETKADMEGVSLAPYILVKPSFFAYVTVTSRNGEKITLAYNDTNDTYIVSSSYVVFSILRTDLLDPEYLFMYFNRPEFDRYARFNSWGSARETFSWEDLCDISIELPDISIQQKYVDIYKALVANQKSYERGLEDLRLVCDGHFDVAKKRKTLPLGNYIESVDRRNADSRLDVADVKGITNNKEFSETRADVGTTDLTKFKVVCNGEFAYNSRTDGRDMLVLALNRSPKNLIVTFNYGVFRVRKEKQHEILPEYLYAFFKRAEFDRRVRFCSWGSSQELLSWGNLCDIQVPVPSIQEQRSIACVMDMYIQRRSINERLKAQIKDICPILIKGSLEEGESRSDRRKKLCHH